MSDHSYPCFKEGHKGAFCFDCAMALRAKLTDIERDRQVGATGRLCAFCNDMIEHEGEPNIAISHYLKHFHETRKEIEALQEENRRLLGKLKMIASMCGNPDAKEGCRLILRECDDALNPQGEGK